MGIYLWKDNQQLGPFEEADIKSRLADGALSYDDLAWREGMSDWQPLRQIYPEPSTPPSPTATTTASNLSAGIFLWKDNQQLGPFDETEIRHRVAAGALSVEDLAWREGISDWQPLRQVYPAVAAVQAPTPSASASAPPPLPTSSPLSAAPPDIVGPSVSPPKKSTLKIIASVAISLLILGLGVLKIANKATGLFKKKTGITQTTGPTETTTSKPSVADGKKLYENEKYDEALLI
ncbi:MAG: hypothetical protein QOK24_1661 [Verrucomicrobiota bacterium]|jgi:hypothetical protein